MALALSQTALISLFRIRLQLSLAGGLLLFSLAGCVTPAPPFPEIPAWTKPEADISELTPLEEELWREASEVIDSDAAATELLDNAELTQYLAEVAAHITPPLPGVAPDIQILVTSRAGTNAAAFPDGHILLEAGLITVLENEAQLAHLLGHEIAHVIHRHGLLERLYQNATPSHVDRMKLSRITEDDADRIGFELATKAGYSASAAVRMLKLLRQYSAPVQRDRVRAWESHADLNARVGRMQRIAALPDWQQSSQLSEGPFLAVTDPIRLDVVEMDMADKSWFRARGRLEKFIKRNPEDARAYYLLGETIRRVSLERRKDQAVLENYQRAVELDPNHPNALRALGLLLLDLRREPEAKPFLESYLRERPDAIDRRLIERYLAQDEAQEAK